MLLHSQLVPSQDDVADISSEDLALVVFDDDIRLGLDVESCCQQ